MSDKDGAIISILNALGKELTFDRLGIQQILEIALDDYQIRYQTSEVSALDLEEKIESYFACQAISKTLNTDSAYQYKLRLKKFADMVNRPVEDKHQ